MERHPEQVWLDRACTLVWGGKHAEAESIASQALKEYPRSLELRRRLAAAYLRTHLESETASVGRSAGRTSR